MMIRYPYNCRIIIFSLFMLLFSQAAWPALQLPPLNSPPTDQQLTGKFTWFDLATSNLEREKGFYHAVFGWQYKSISESQLSYTLIYNQDRAIAGMFEVEPKPEIKQGSLWFGLFSVPDPALVVKLVKQHGGLVQIDPVTIAQRGSHALFRDPEGALFGVLHSQSGDREDGPIPIGDFFWMDLLVKDQQAASQFYQRLGNYEVTGRDAGNNTTRLILSSAGMPRAGIMPLPADVSRAGWLPYVRVANVNEALEKVINAGGNVLVPPQPELLNGNLAIIADPLGGVIGVINWVSEEAVGR